MPGLSVLTTFPRKSEMDYANGGFVDHYKPIEERWGGWYVTGKKVPARHMGNYPLIVPKGIDHAAAGARVARRAVRSRRLPDALQRHRRADGARAPGALQQPRHARDVGDASWARRCASPKRPTRSPITCCSSTKRRFPAADRGLVRLRREVQRAGPEGCEGPIAARARSEDAAAEISAELHDLFAGVSRRCRTRRRIW